MICNMPKTKFYAFLQENSKKNTKLKEIDMAKSVN